MNAEELPEAQAGRMRFLRGARRADHTALCQLQSMTNSEKKLKVFTEDDPWFILESTFLKNHAEKACLEVFRARVWAALPDAARRVDLKTSIRELQALQVR